MNSQPFSENYYFIEWIGQIIMLVTIHGKTLELTRGDVTHEATDAIVNAANSELSGGGGVDGAIHRAGGAKIIAETKRRYPNGCSTGTAVISGAGDLQAQFVIHAVGPVWNEGQKNEAALLGNAYHNCLKLAVEYDCRSISFPSISTGAYGYPFDQAAHIALGTVIEFLQTATQPELVRFVLFDDKAYRVFKETLTALTTT